MTREIRLTIPLPANADQLVKELEALNIPGVRTYSVFGSPGECAGVYVWAERKLNGDLVPQGHYLHLDDEGQTLSPADENRIRQAISDHKPLPPEPPAHVKVLRTLHAKVKGGQPLTPTERSQLDAALLDILADSGII